MRIIQACILAAVVVGLGLGGTRSEEPKAKEVSDYIALINEFAENQVAAEKKWCNQRVVFQPYISSVERENKVACIQSGRITFRFEAEQEGGLVPLKKGDKVTLTGEIQGIYLSTKLGSKNNHLIVNKCKIIKHEPKK